MSTDAPDTISWSAAFIDDLIERVNDLSELKLALCVARHAATYGSPLIPLTVLDDAAVARAILGGGSPRPSSERLAHVLDQAVADDVVVRVAVREHDTDVTWIGPATAETRVFIDRLRSGDIDAEVALAMSPEAGLATERPNVFALYERMIGPLTPLVAEELRDAERMYPARWIEDAMASAVDYNKRNWRYVLSILRGWEESGAPNAIPRRYS